MNNNKERNCTVVIAGIVILIISYGKFNLGTISILESITFATWTIVSISMILISILSPKGKILYPIVDYLIIFTTLIWILFFI